MTADEFHYLILVIGAFSLFGVVLAWTEWFSNRG